MIASITELHGTLLDPPANSRHFSSLSNNEPLPGGAQKPPGPPQVRRPGRGSHQVSAQTDPSAKVIAWSVLCIRMPRDRLNALRFPRPQKQNACKRVAHRRWLICGAVRTGLEPATPCVTGMYSNQLNYRTIDSLFAW